MTTAPLNIFFAFVAVLALIGVAAWLVRRFGGSRLGANTNRGRMPRLAVVDAAAVDGRRRLVLVRRDNIEHLLMIGGPTDIVVEPNIVRATPARDQLPQRTGTEPPPRISPLPDCGWSDDSPRADLDQVEPQIPELPSRPARPSLADEVRRPAAPERRSDPLVAFVPEPFGGPSGGRPEPRMGSRSEPMMPRPSRPSPAEAPKPPPLRAPERSERAERPTVPPPLPSSPPPSADQSLAEMAQRLEAALRRPGESAAPPVAPEPLPARPAQSETPPPAKSGFENLEDEMASLLGRSKNPPS